MRLPDYFFYIQENRRTVADYLMEGYDESWPMSICSCDGTIII
jgi:hypothetical protein